MSNHIHLLAQTSQTPLSKIVHNLAFRYSQDFNKRYGKIGHLFQGRYKAILLDEKDYFLKLIRYIHMNPVRANMVKEPLDYHWSGHKTYLGEDEIAWLTHEPALAKFDPVLGRARKLYNDYILKRASQEELEEFRRGFKDGQVLGNDNFAENIRETYGQKIESLLPLQVIIEATCLVFAIENTMLSSLSQSRRLSLARGAIVAQALENGMTLKDLAIAFKRDESTISRLGSRFLSKCHQCDDMKEQFERLKEKTLQLANLQA